MQIYRLDITDDERKGLVAMIDQAVRSNGVDTVHVASHLLRRVQLAPQVVPAEPAEPLEPAEPAADQPRTRAPRVRKKPAPSVIAG